MFSKSEALYDAIYEWKDYKAESALLLDFIACHKSAPGSSLLDVACGTGGHIPFLRETCTIEGLDLDPAMLEIANRKCPGVRFHSGDMLDFDLGKTFDAVVSLFSSIGYMKTPERLTRAAGTMARHVGRGGVLIIEPFFLPEAWKPRTKAPGVNLVDRPDITIVRMSDWVRRDNLIVWTFHYLVGTPEKVEHFTELHEIALFTDAEYRAAFAAAGMTVTHDAEGLTGRGLYIGTWPQ